MTTSIRPNVSCADFTAANTWSRLVTSSSTGRTASPYCLTRSLRVSVLRAVAATLSSPHVNCAAKGQVCTIGKAAAVAIRQHDQGRLSRWRLVGDAMPSRRPRWGSGGADGVHCLVEQVAERLCLI